LEGKKGGEGDQEKGSPYPATQGKGCQGFSNTEFESRRESYGLLIPFGEPTGPAGRAEMGETYFVVISWNVSKSATYEFRGQRK
jgi:hypothetical protein